MGLAGFQRRLGVRSGLTVSWVLPSDQAGKG